MWQAQGALPQLRLPSLEESRDRMLRACKPLLSADDFAQTRAAAETFARRGGPAWQLQRELQELCVAANSLLSISFGRCFSANGSLSIACSLF